jgi:hypothetical protein
MNTSHLNPPPSPRLYWDSLPLSRRRKLLALLGAMVLAALRASPPLVEVDDERRHR